MALGFAGCASQGGLRLPDGGAADRGEVGVASWYGPGFHGRRTAGGERFDSRGLSAAHRTLALGSLVRVTNITDGRSIVLRINDRGPYVRGRIIDLSYGAADALGIVRQGLARVRVEPLDLPAGSRTLVAKRRGRRSARRLRTVAERAKRPAPKRRIAASLSAASTATAAQPGRR
jgi:rare lipoprotein A